MMTALAGSPDWQSEHAAVALPGVPVIAHEGCRERVSKPSLPTTQMLHGMILRWLPIVQLTATLMFPQHLAET